MHKKFEKNDNSSRGPVNMTSEIKRAILESFKKTGNKTAVAIKFGVSARTIGRVLQEVKKKEPPPPSVEVKLAALEADFEKLRTLFSQLVSKPTQETQPAIVYVRHRQRPDMDLLNLKVEKVQDHHYSNPYRHSFVGSSYVEIGGIPTLKIRYSDQPKITPDFFLRHPVSPDCKVYPYVSIGDKIPSDPPEGKYCDCGDCRDWRYLLGKQKQMELSRQEAAGDYAVFHGAKLVTR